MEFFQNIWKWLTDNSDKILAFLTSAQFIAIITVIVNAIRQHKVIKANTLSADSLTTELKENGKNKTTLSSINSQSQSLVNSAKDTKATLEDITNSLDILVSKLNTVLDVQAIVYSTLKDDTMRKTVNNLLLNAKYNDTAIKTKMQDELNSLKEKVADLSDGIKDIEAATTKVSETITDSSATVEVSETKVTRY